jgi:hypothetical protein
MFAQSSRRILSTLGDFLVSLVFFNHRGHNVCTEFAEDNFYSWRLFGILGIFLITEITMFASCLYRVHGAFINLQFSVNNSFNTLL